MGDWWGHRITRMFERICGTYDIQQRYRLGK